MQTNSEGTLDEIVEKCKTIEEKIEKKAKLMTNDFVIGLTYNENDENLAKYFCKTVELIQNYAGGVSHALSPNIRLVCQEKEFFKKNKSNSMFLMASNFSKKLVDSKNVIKGLLDKNHHSPFVQIGKLLANVYGPIQQRFSCVPHPRHLENHQKLRNAVKTVAKATSNHLPFEEFNLAIRVIICSKFCIRCMAALLKPLNKNAVYIENFISLILTGIQIESNSEIVWFDAEDKEYKNGNFLEQRTISLHYVRQSTDSTDFDGLVEKPARKSEITQKKIDFQCQTENIQSSSSTKLDENKLEILREVEKILNSYSRSLSKSVNLKEDASKFYKIGEIQRSLKKWRRENGENDEIFTFIYENSKIADVVNEIVKEILEIDPNVELPTKLDEIKRQTMKKAGIKKDEAADIFEKIEEQIWIYYSRKAGIMTGDYVDDEDDEDDEDDSYDDDEEEDEEVEEEEEEAQIIENVFVANGDGEGTSEHPTSPAPLPEIELPQNSPFRKDNPPEIEIFDVFNPTIPDQNASRRISEIVDEIRREAEVLEIPSLAKDTGKEMKVFGPSQEKSKNNDDEIVVVKTVTRPPTISGPIQIFLEQDETFDFDELDGESSRRVSNERRMKPRFEKLQNDDDDLEVVYEKTPTGEVKIDKTPERSQKEQQVEEEAEGSEYNGPITRKRGTMIEGEDGQTRKSQKLND